MKIIILRDTVFHEVGKPVIVCKASASPQYAPDWITDTSAWRLGVSCGALSIPTSGAPSGSVIQNLVTASAEEIATNEVVIDPRIEEVQEDPAPKKHTGK